MKKIVLLLLGCSTFFISCSNEAMAVAGQEDVKSEAIQNFKKAVVDSNKPENLPTEEEKREIGYPKMNERRLDLLVPAAKNLIKSTGVKDDQIAKSANGNKEVIVEWALKIVNSNNN